MDQQSLSALTLRGQINLRLPVPRYIIKLSSDFRTAIRHWELLRCWLAGPSWSEWPVVEIACGLVRQGSCLFYY